ncbi:MAG: Fe3+-siderophores ABC transporter protein [Bdellovibrionaceae bacterium]|nr:Fe3+-siderophores ABC transporter protein [Pseudobdellovibrionaceae bacterium]
MVPSWTETLLLAGIPVVGRTRFCIHPEDLVQTIPIVGGTKDVKWDLVGDLKPDFILLDQEENPIEMAEESPCRVLATHVHSLETLQFELQRLGTEFQSQKLIAWSLQLQSILDRGPLEWNEDVIPALKDWVITPMRPGPRPVLYVIWKNPWMAVGPNTFIGSVLHQLGAQVLHFLGEEKYPVIEIEDFKDALILFSSEPYPFHKKLEELRRDGLAGAVVDGEAYSWFGIRSLEFLKRCYRIS